MTDALLDTTATPKPLPDLEPVGWLLSDLSVRGRLLAKLDPEEALVTSKILQHATQLEAGTGWDADTLVRCLGCPVVTIKDFEDLGRVRLDISSGYLALLWELDALLETPFDKRTLLLGYGHLYRLADNDVDSLRAAFFTKNPTWPFDYLQLGEVQSALDTALRVIKPDAFTEPRNPFGDLPRVHISTSRLDALITGRNKVLGEAQVVPRMEDHIADCDACRSARDERREVLAEQELAVHSQVS